MKFKVPYTFSNIEVLKKRSERFVKLVKSKKTTLNPYLKGASQKLNHKEYLAICYRSFIINIIFFSIILVTLLGILGARFFFFYGLGASLLVSIFVFFTQISYPKMFANKKASAIEKNLIPALQDMKVQLNSGIPLFKILINLSMSDYGEVSEEFKKITREINSGVSQIDALESYGKINHSKYFRRVLWQFSNGMRAGSDMGLVIEEEIKNLSDEQTIQIQNYGSRLNPVIMFYMLIAVILPSLGVSFFTIISSLLDLTPGLAKLVFFGIFGFVLFMQIMFLGMIRSRRPSLL